MEQKASLKNSLLTMAVFPILLLGIIVTIVVYTRFNKVMHSEVEKELMYVASAVDDMLELVSPGDYVTYGDTVLTLVKGENILNDRFEFIDAIKDDTGLEISIFYNNIRFLTTITNAQNERILGSYSSSLITDDVIKSGEAKFYSSVGIGDKKYFAYYLPVYNSDDTCAGMIGVAKEINQVKRLIATAVYPVLIVALFIMVLAIAMSVKYSTKLIKDLTQLKEFMKEVEASNFKTEFDYSVMNRNDEITDMCKSASHMQRSLRTLIEQDALTGLDNRRSANKYMREMQKELTNANEKFALVLGDIDFFKKVNDTYGHDAGDEVLKYVASVLKTHMKGKGFASRWGGEEFLLGFKDATMKDAAKETMSILEEIRGHIVECNEFKIKVTMSFGVAKGRDDCSVDVIVKSADDKLYYAKEHGRNQVVVNMDGDIEEDVNESDVATMSGLADMTYTSLEESKVDEELLDYVKGLNDTSSTENYLDMENVDTSALEGLDIEDSSNG